MGKYEFKTFSTDNLLEYMDFIAKFGDVECGCPIKFYEPNNIEIIVNMYFCEDKGHYMYNVMAFYNDNFRQIEECIWSWSYSDIPRLKYALDEELIEDIEDFLNKND